MMGDQHYLKHFSGGHGAILFKAMIMDEEAAYLRDGKKNKQDKKQVTFFMGWGNGGI